MSSTNVDMTCAVFISKDDYFVSNQIDKSLWHLDIDENGHEFARVGNLKWVSGQSLTVLHRGLDPDKQVSCQFSMEFNASSRTGLLCN